MRLGVRFLSASVKRGFSYGQKIAARFRAGGWRSRSPFGDLGDGATAAGADTGTGVQRANIFAGWSWPFDRNPNWPYIRFLLFGGVWRLSAIYMIIGKHRFVNQ